MTSISGMESVTLSRSENGLRVQISYRAGPEAEQETICATVLLKRENVTIRELQEKAARRSIELLQQFLEALPPGSEIR